VCVGVQEKERDRNKRIKFLVDQTELFQYVFFSFFCGGWSLLTDPLAQAFPRDVDRNGLCQEDAQGPGKTTK